VTVAEKRASMLATPTPAEFLNRLEDPAGGAGDQAVLGEETRSSVPFGFRFRSASLWKD
jgi:hypothetical protein